MKRISLALAALTLLVSFGAVQAADQTKLNAPPPAKGTTRVAVINLGLVISNYEKAREFKNDLASSMKQLQEEAKGLQQDLAAWQKELQKADLSSIAKERYEEKIINARRRLEDLGRTANSRVGKTQQAQLVTLWSDVQGAVKAYSAKHGIDLVIAYGEPLKQDDVMSFLNIERKMRGVDQGGAVPFFMTSGVDISEAVSDLLNKTYRETKAGPSGAGSRDR